MTSTKATSREQIQAEIRNLENTEVAVETNEGTWGPQEAGRKVGTSDPRFANYTVYETPAGKRRVQGADPERAPGRARRLGADEMRELRRRIAELRRQLRESR